MRISVDVLEELRDHLECLTSLVKHSILMLEKLENAMQKARGTHAENEKKRRGTHVKKRGTHAEECGTHAENLPSHSTANEADNSRLSSAFGTSGNGENSTPRAGGVGGVDCTIRTLDVQNNGTLPNNDVTSKVTLNSFNQSKEEIFSEKNKKEKNPKKKESKKEKWERLSRELTPYWACYPKEGRSDWKNSLFAFCKLRKDIPDVEFFYGIVVHFVNEIWTGENCKIPSFKTFLEREEWKGINEALKAKMERNRGRLKEIADSKLKQFNGAFKQGENHNA